MSNSADDIERLEGMTAMIEDWHAKVVVLVVRNFTRILEHCMSSWYVCVSLCLCMKTHMLVKIIVILFLYTCTYRSYGTACIQLPLDLMGDSFSIAKLNQQTECESRPF